MFLMFVFCIVDMEQTDGVEDIVPEGVRWPPLGATQSEISGSNLSVADGDYWTRCLTFALFLS